LDPAAVVILAGTNDLAGNTGPTTVKKIYGNIISMIQLARANNIKVVLCSVLPAYDYPWRPGLKPAEKIVKLNSLLQSYASKSNIVYVNFFTPMADKRDGLKSEYSKDGVHPTLEGYKVMDVLVVKGIEKALSGQ
ncbi:MAG TPA: GDSL-type esterase/lipase family protein, partial [Bacteroidales bacterium]|nr:GDSL-type esterase/lipase family protein [Bacteroidales bacterium]